MNEMINATTSLIPILTIFGDKTDVYYNTSVFFFSIIATINHIFPENLNGTTHLVKLLVTNILFSIIKVPAVLGFTVSLIDLTPIFTKNKTLIKIGELFLQVPRQVIDVYLVYKLSFIDNYHYRGMFIVICKVIYYLERRLRIKRGERSNFYFFHCAEHFGLYTLLMTYAQASISIFSYIKLFICFIFGWSVLIFLINLYFYLYHEERVPHYIKHNKEMMDILKKKLNKNLFDGKVYNYICKPWTTHLKMEIITWRTIEYNCRILSSRLDPNEIDIVVGIATGGVFVAAAIGNMINKPVKIINSRLWSGITFYENYKKVSNFFMGSEEVKPKISGIPDLQGKRILLCDDTTYTGLTIMNCIDWAKNICYAKSVKTLIIWTHRRFIPDYSIGQKRVPIIWEWGAEVD